jgi:peptidoglycan/xylan/chitin deacetylase (PgdA/CDA1 family)
MRHLLLHAVGSAGGRFVLEPRNLDIISKAEGRHIMCFDDGYLSVYEYLDSRDDPLVSQCIFFLPAGKMGQENDWDKSGELSGRPLMTWENAAALRKKGGRLGSHGMTHADLTKLTDSELEYELKESKRLIEERTNAAVESLAYPFGYFNRRVIGFAKAAGYKEAFTTCDSAVQGHGDPYRRRRIEIKGTDSEFVIKLKLSRWYDLKAAWELPKLSAEKIVKK